MGLKLVLGRAGTGKTGFCLEQIQARLKAEPEGHPLILLLPEHATFKLERQLAATAELGGFMRAHVFGFRRLAQRVLQEEGGAARPHLTELGKRLVLSRILTNNKKELKVLRRAANQRTFADTLAGIIQEFKTYRVSPEQLNSITANLRSPLLTDKLNDLTLLYQNFTNFINERYLDPEDFLTLLAANIPKSSLIQKAEIWIDGFSWFNPQETAVLAQMLKTAADVTVTLCLADAMSPEHDKETALFHRQWDTRQRLIALAQSLDLSVEETELNDTRRFNNIPVLGHIERNFFTFPLTPWQNGAPGLMLAEAANRRAEVEGIVRDIIRLAREKGFKWRDIAILIRDTDSYGHLLEAVLADYDIPCFSDSQRQSVHHPLAELIRSALEIISSNWSYDAVFRCLKTDFFSLARSEIDELENYVLEFGIRGTRWTKAEQWTFVRKLSLAEDSDLNEYQQQYLERLNAIRWKAVTELAEFEKNIRQADTGRDFTIAVYEFLDALGVPEKLSDWADAAETAGELEQAREHRQVWNCVVELLEQLDEACGDQLLKLADYALTINDGLESMKLSLIPPGLDYVTVAPLERSSELTVKAVYLPGVTDGVLPRRIQDEGLLTDSERSQLIAAGVELAPGAAAANFAERYIVYTALTRASDYLWVSYPLADEEGKGVSPSIVVKRLRDMVPQVPLKLLALEPQQGEEQDFIVHPERSLYILGGVLRQYKEGTDIHPVWWDVYNYLRQRTELNAPLRRIIAGLFHSNFENSLPVPLANRLFIRNNKLRGSVTRFESYRACPFKHFAQYGLSLKERAVFRLQAPDLGQFLHTALKLFGDRMATAGREWSSVNADEYGAICAEIVNQLAPKLQNEILLSSEQHKHLLGRLKRTVERSVARLIEFDKVSKFKPVALEKSFGMGGGESLPALVYLLEDGLAVEIAGQIDRLDAAEHQGQRYLLVIDYKSGGAWLKLADVFYGLKLQLLTYLLVAQGAAPELLGCSNSSPAGVLYYFLRSPQLSGQTLLSPEEISKKINNMLKMPGWTLADPEVARLLDNSLTGRSDFLKIALKQDNSFYSNCLPYVKSQDEFELLLKHVQNILRNTGQQIAAGNIAIEPYSLAGQTPCSYCPYRPVCQFDQLLPDNDYRRLPGRPEQEMMAELSAGSAVVNGEEQA